MLCESFYEDTDYDINNVTNKLDRNQELHRCRFTVSLLHRSLKHPPPNFKNKSLVFINVCCLFCFICLGRASGLSEAELSTKPRADSFPWTTISCQIQPTYLPLCQHVRQHCPLARCATWALFQLLPIVLRMRMR